MPLPVRREKGEEEASLRSLMKPWTHESTNECFLSLSLPKRALICCCISALDQQFPAKCVRALRASVRKPYRNGAYTGAVGRDVERARRATFPSAFLCTVSAWNTQRSAEKRERERREGEDGRQWRRCFFRALSLFPAARSLSSHAPSAPPPRPPPPSV